MDKFKEECGIFGIYGHSEAANLTYLGLYALQHRGQESVGIASSDGGRLQMHKAMGYVADNFDEATITRLAGTSAVGHVRYSTAGESGLKNAQPILIDCAHGEIAICHNGNLVNAQELRDALVSDGSIFQTTSDTEVLLHLYARSKAATPEQALIESVAQAQGAFSLVLLTKDRLIAVRDPHGFRPLTLGRLGDAYIVCSETCALDLIDAEWIRDIEPGEVFIVGPDGERSVHPFPPARQAHCIFEHVYFARPDSYVFGKSVNEVRTELGRVLAREQPAAADVVVPIPDSGVCAATGFAEAAGLPLQMGLIRNHYVGPHVHRAASVDSAFRRAREAEPGEEHLQGRRVVLVDDSIVRGTTSRKIVKMVRAAGATEVHMRISCPPTISPCFYGVDTPQRSELIAATHSLEEIRTLHRRGFARLSQPGRAALGGGRRARVVLHVVLHGRLSGRVSAERGGVSPTRSQAGGMSGRSRGVIGVMRRSRRLLARARRRRTAGTQRMRPARKSPRRDRRRSISSAHSTSGRERSAPKTVRRAPDATRSRHSSKAARKHNGRVRPLSRAGAAHGIRRRGRSRSRAMCSRIANNRLRLVAYGWFEYPSGSGGAAARSRRRWIRASEFVRPALTRAIAAYGDDPRARGAPAAGRARRRPLSRRGDRGARRLSRALCAGANHRGRQARRAAAGRSGHCARRDGRRRRRWPCCRVCRRAAPTTCSRAVAAALCLLGSTARCSEDYLEEDADVCGVATAATAVARGVVARAGRTRRDGSPAALDDA